MKRWIFRFTLGLSALVVLALVCGAVYEALARSQLASRVPARGKRVDIGGRKLQLDCQGMGSPTVVFEAGLGTTGLLDWSLVHEQVASVTRACAYSRAGIFASDPGIGERDANAIADDLHALLVRAGERPPLVLVAHSLGGIYALTYTHQFGADVAGLVLVDILHPEVEQRMAAAGLDWKAPLGGLEDDLEIAKLLGWTGLLRAQIGSDDAEAAYLPTSILAVRDELVAIDRSLAQARASRPLGSRPLFVLTAGKLTEGFLAEAHWTAAQGEQFQAVKRSLQDDQASWSTQSQHEIVADADHDIQHVRPDRVVNATQWVVAAVRADTAR